jgi:hypothetical protein
MRIASPTGLPSPYVLFSITTLKRFYPLPVEPFTRQTSPLQGTNGAAACSLSAVEGGPMQTDLPPDDARQSTHDGILRRVLVPSFILIAIAAIAFLIFY